MIDRNFILKAYHHLLNRIRFFNVSNKNVLDTLNKVHYYKKYKKKYHRFLEVKDYGINSKKTSYDKVWIFWYQGIENAPDLVKSTIKSIKSTMKNKKIVILTKDNLNEYVSLPDYIENKFQKGQITMAHYSDLLRIELLTTFGGLWLDSTILMTNKPFFIDKDIPLFVFKDVSLYRKEELPVAASSWLIYSNGKSNILCLTKELLYEYWKTHSHVSIYLVFHIFFKLATEVYKDEWENVPTYSNVPPHILQFELLNKYDEGRFKQIEEMSDIHKLNHRIKTDDKDSNYYHILMIWSEHDE